MTADPSFIAEQATLARDRGQGRHIPETHAQALNAESGIAAAWVDFPGHVKLSDELIGTDPYFRAAYDTQVAQFRELNIAAGREPHEWVRVVSDAALRRLRGDAAAVGNGPLALLAGDALAGDEAARERLVGVFLKSSASRVQTDTTPCLTCGGGYREDAARRDPFIGPYVPHAEFCPEKL